MNLVVCKENGDIQEMVGSDRIVYTEVDDSPSDVLKFRITVSGDREYLESVRKGAYFYDVAEPDAVVNIVSTVLHEKESVMIILGSSSRESLIKNNLQ